MSEPRTELRVVAVVPAFNESERIGETVRAILGIPGVSEVFVVDDASSDGTATIAEDAGARVVRLRRNIGKGQALAVGLGAARSASTARIDVALLLDGDLGASAAEAARLLEPVLDGRTDMAVAVLPKPPGSGGFGLVLRLARFGIWQLGGWEPRAPLSGQRVLAAPALQAMGRPAHGFGVEVAMTVRVLRSGLRVSEVDVPMTHAPTGRDIPGFKHRGRQFVDVARALVALAFEAVLANRA